MADFYREKINNPLLTADLERVRNGRYQEFRRKGGSFHSEPVLRLEHENKALYAELIDGEWYWVNGCNLCDDCHPDEKKKGWGYLYCDTHNVCVDCGIHRKDLKDTPWGTPDGAFLCKPCESRERDAAKLKAVQQAQRDNLDEMDTMCEQHIKCPYCGSEHEDDDDYSYSDANNVEFQCGVCEETFKVSAEVEITYTTEPVKPIEEVRKAILGDEYESDDDDDTPEVESDSQTFTDALPARDEMSDVINQAVSEDNGKD